VAKAELILEFKDKVTAGLKTVEGQLQSLSKTAASIKFASFITAANAAIQIGKEFAGVINEYIQAGKEAIQSDVQFEVTLRNLTSATRKQIEAIRQYLQALSMKIGVDDEELERLTALALSMGVQGSQIEKLLQVTKAYSLALGVDLQTAMVQIVKGGEGFTQGLRRAGIILDESRVKSEGLSYVLNELGKRFDFVNEYMESGAGAYERFQIVVKNVKEEIGKTVLNSTGFQYALNELAKTIQAVSPMINLLSYVFGAVGFVVEKLAAGLNMIITLLKHLFLSVWRAITGGIKSAVDEIQKGFSEILRYSLEIGRSFQDTGASAKALENLTNRLKENMREIAVLGAQIQSSYRSMVQSDIEAYYLAQRNQVALRDSSNAVKEMAFLFAGIESSLQNAGKYLQEMASETLRKMEMQARTIAEYVYDFVENIWEGVRAGEDLVDVLKQAVEELAIAVVKAVVFQLIYSAVSSAIGLPGVPRLPFLAAQSGGVVDRPTLVLAGEKEREYIIPESKFPQPVVFVEVRNANPDTYARVLVQMSKRAKRMVYSSLAGA
jgi:hypothetical protein